jgi:hypothetical protein
MPSSLGTNKSSALRKSIYCRGDYMSINALTNAAMSRRRDFEPANHVPQSLAEIAKATGVVPPVPVSPSGQPAITAPSGMNTALAMLTMYIPTEVLTLYVAAVAGLPSGRGPSSGIRLWLPFLSFLIATPAIVWIAFATKVKSAGKSIPFHPSLWPVWEMAAATIAYFAWAFALPDTPFLQFQNQWYSPALAGFLVLVVSYGLGALGPLMQRTLSS